MQNDKKAKAYGMRKEKRDFNPMRFTTVEIFFYFQFYIRQKEKKERNQIYIK